MIQVYTGDGKGKTTAALGLALRASGGDLKVYIGQFLKGKYYSELNSLKKLKNIKVEQFGRSGFVKKNPNRKDFQLAQNGLKRVKEIIAKGCYDIVILDEINIALKLKLIKIKDAVDLIKNTPKNIELILTGRYAPDAILKSADLVSEMRQIKHYLKKGVKARKGIEY